MSFENVKNLPGYAESSERRNKKREATLMFATYLDSLPEEVEMDIKDTSWRIASEVVEDSNTDEGWYGGSAFKKQLERMLKRYFSGYSRDTDALIAEEALSNPGDREVAELAFQEAEKELSRFSELEFSAPEEVSAKEVDEGQGETSSTEHVSSSEKVVDELGGEEETGVMHQRKKEKTLAGDRRSAAERMRAARANNQEADISREQELERLNSELKVIKEEMSDWEVKNQNQYEHAVDVLVNHHGLSPEDAMKLVNGINTMSHWDTMRTIRDVRRSYFLQTKEGPTKGRGFSR